MHLEQQFLEISRFIQEAKYNAFKHVNATLITLYWRVGEYISKKVDASEWGMGVVDRLAEYLQNNHPDIQGFTRRGLYRMKQFYETYKDNQIVSTLLTQLSWSNHLIILSRTKTAEEREFYVKLSVKERYSFRELERQINTGLFERYMSSSPRVLSPVLAKPEYQTAMFRDSYLFNFLDVPEDHSEHDLQKAIVHNLKQFILECGKDFTFVGEEYRIQVGNSDYFLDLLFFHRALCCLVVFEIKINEFRPEYLGKLNFYLEALDRDIKKPHENPSVGIILCTSKDNDVVEYAMSRNLSPALVAEYKTKLIDKKILQNKMHELYLASLSDAQCDEHA